METSDKYPRTFHLPWSAGATNDDKIAASVDSLLGRPIIITEKMDGSNTSLEAEGCFARTHSGPPTHASFDGLKALHASIKHEITHDTQLFGEWCFALHSIDYSELPGYFLLFGVRYWNPVQSDWASWEEVKMWAEEIHVPTVPVLFEGQINSESELKDITKSLMIQPSCCGGIREGVVVRLATTFPDKDFSQSVMKSVRANHVQTSTHWREQQIIRNGLKF